MIDLSKNTNPYYPNKKMFKYMKKNIKKIKNYSDKYIEVKDESFLEKYKLTPENIIVTEGTLGAMDLILRQYEKKSVGMFNPTFWGLKELAKKNDKKLVERRIAPKLEYDEQEIKELAMNCDILYLCNSNNPTLNYIERDKLIDIVKNNRKCLFVIDETVLSFDVDYDSKSAMKYVEELDNLIVLVSLSKILGICGLRVGLLVTSSHIKKEYRNFQIPYSANIMASMFINRYLSILNNLKKSKIRILNNFRFLEKSIQKDIVSEVIFNNSSFALLKLKEGINYEDLNLYLFNHGIKVSAINKYYSGLDAYYIRVGSAKKKQYKKLINLLKKYKEVNYE